MAHGNGAFNGHGGYALARDGEVHVDGGEHFWVGVCPLAGELDAATTHIVAATLEA